MNLFDPSGLCVVSPDELWDAGISISPHQGCMAVEETDRMRGGGGPYAGGLPCGFGYGTVCGFAPGFGPPPTRIGPPPPQRVGVECQITVGYSEAKPLGISTDKNHSTITLSYFWEMSDGSTIPGYSVVIDAGFQLAVEELASVPSIFTPISILSVSFSANGRYGNAASGNVYYRSGIGETVCASSAAIWGTAQGISAGNYLYGGLFSNSNSFTSTLLAAGGIFLPPPPDSPGWGEPLIPIIGPVVPIPGTKW